jgi:hypothetical protein
MVPNVIKFCSFVQKWKETQTSNDSMVMPYVYLRKKSRLESANVRIIGVAQSVNEGIPD